MNVVTLVGLVALIVFLLFVIDVALMRRIVLEGRHKIIGFRYDEIRAELVFERTPAVEMPGRYGIWVAGGGHLTVGKVLSVDPSNGTVTRAVDAATDVTASGSLSGRWTSHAFADPQATGYDYTEVSIESVGVLRPAWVFPGGSSDHWVIHLHGVKSSRASALRGIPVVQRLGYTSLVPSFYADSESEGREGATLGLREAVDVEAAIRFAIENGAQTVTLFGWSMGGTIALILADEFEFRDRIANLVLIGPALNWRAAIERGMHAARLPSFLISLVCWSLETRILSRLAHMARPVRFDRLIWSNRTVRVPTLLVHSRGDMDSSWRDSELLAAGNVSIVELAEFPSVPHLLEWNTQTQLFEETVEAFLTHSLI